jgi:hypothetical protein
MVRAALLLAAILIVVASTGWWTPALARSTVCAEDEDSFADAILLDTLDHDYLLFERAELLQQSGRGATVFALVNQSASGAPSRVEEAILDAMARIARLPAWHPIVFEEVEPISLNAARTVRDRLVAEQVSSVLLVVPVFRSRRSMLVFDTVLGEAGIRVSCVPVTGTKTPENWTDTWHGIQDVGLQLLKLQYYRFWVMPRN